mmetsp:Transcript_31310/g.65938  ORF Transcript_31310/g.65938 Transcript_31310/m.65938 type:complete len:351 (-) Transcript_31310:130-1182(-)
MGKHHSSRDTSSEEASFSDNDNASLAAYGNGNDDSSEGGGLRPSRHHRSSRDHRKESSRGLFASPPASSARLTSLTSPITCLFDGVNLKTLVFCIVGTTMLMKLTSSPLPRMMHSSEESLQRVGDAAMGVARDLKSVVVVPNGLRGAADIMEIMNEYKDEEEEGAPPNAIIPLLEQSNVAEDGVHQGQSIEPNPNIFGDFQIDRRTEENDALQKDNSAQTFSSQNQQQQMAPHQGGNAQQGVVQQGQQQQQQPMQQQPPIQQQTLQQLAPPQQNQHQVNQHQVQIPAPQQQQQQIMFQQQQQLQQVQHSPPPPPLQANNGAVAAVHTNTAQKMQQQQPGGYYAFGQWHQN